MAAIWTAAQGARRRIRLPFAPLGSGFTGIWHAVLQPARTFLSRPHALTGEFGQASAAVAFDWLFEQHEPRVFGYLYRMVSDRQLASDLCQETFLRAWQHFDQIAAYRDPLGWLFRVATNLALDARRGRLRMLRKVRPLGDDDDDGPAGADSTNTVAESALIHDILQGLSPRGRAALVLREVYGMSLEEIAALLDMSSAATKKMLSRAREQFRRRYLREGAEP